jgi:hypothetical protein
MHIPPFGGELRDGHPVNVVEDLAVVDHIHLRVSKPRPDTAATGPGDPPNQPDSQPVTRS